MIKLLKGILLIIFLTGWFPLAYSNDKIIKIPTPPRPAGNTDLIGFSVAPIDTVRVGFVGLGMRGADAVERFTYVPGSKIEAICDLVPERVDSSISYLKRRNIELPATYSGEEDSWKALCENPNVDLVYVATDWQHHVPIALYAMQNGKHVAIEVPSAFTLEDIWALVDTAETNRLHCTILENCVYDDFELNTLNMAQIGLFGEILHTEGSYIHNLEPFWDRYYNNWRLDYNSKHRGDLYPTHGAGPALQLLDIHRGDKMNTLVSMDTKVAGVPLWLSKQGREVPADFKNGDHTMTMIRTENGKTIHIQHDVVNPRPYSRMYQLTGTNGFANKYPIEGYAFDAEQLAEDSIPDHENLSYHKFVTDEQKKSLLEKYQHPILKEIGPKAKEVGGHGGMDYIMDYRLIYCLNNGLPLDMDVYDLAEWCAITPLSEISIENGSAPVEVPDFTRGAWNKVKGYRHAGVEGEAPISQ
ncbi:MAG: Gfo/Idh/MocA family oxidoreductase [Muribaculaceae bacterium]|nr:Gfo/Idh/MocA family oxidoreductase [Muribaculaceae bacterium]